MLLQSYGIWLTPLSNFALSGVPLSVNSCCPQLQAFAHAAEPIDPSGQRLGWLPALKMACALQVCERLQTSGHDINEQALPRGLRGPQSYNMTHSLAI